MKLHEIAKATKLENQQVAADFGFEGGKGVHLRGVDDAKAIEYIESHGGEVPADDSVVRFWSVCKQHYIPSDGTDRKDIKFFDWVYEGKADSPEVEFLRSNPAQMQAIHIYEIVDCRFEETGMIGDFILALNKKIYTGASTQDGPSREGRNSAKALLGEKRLSKLDNTVSNDARLLVREVANSISLKVDAMPVEL